MIAPRPGAGCARFTSGRRRIGGRFAKRRKPPWHSPETLDLVARLHARKHAALGWPRRGGDLLGTAALEDFTPRYIRFDFRPCQNFITAASVSPIRALTTTTSNTSRALVM
jgi:hypothetical protein